MLAPQDALGRLAVLPPHICDEIFCIAKVDFGQRLQQNAAGTLQYQGATFGANAKYEYKT